MKLFQPNNLSRLKPEFIPVQDDGLRTSVAAILQQYKLPTEALRLSSVAGANVVSENFKVEVSDERYFLKRRPADQLSKLTKEAVLTAKLRALGVKAPHVIPNASGELVSQSGLHVYLLCHFQDGHYFSGQGTELESAADAFANISRTATQIISGSTDNEFLTRLPSLLDSAQTSHELIREHREKILEALAQVKLQSSSIESTIRPSHLDFHPLNLLMRNGEVECVLDFEHLKPYPVAAAVGFAGYKLIRQMLTDQEQRLSSRTLGERWLQRVNDESCLTLTAMRHGAAYRVLSLIDYILAASIERGDNRFLFDLEKQILSLYELEAMNWS